NLLKNNSEYISGEEISKTLGVTRACIWKHINSLKNEGYSIEGISKKGYKLLSSPTELSLIEIKNNLNQNSFGENLYFFDEINSTNLYAKKIASSGAPNGTLIVAKSQNSGKGRLERAWSSPNGGLWFSLILRPNLSPMEASKVPLIAAASIWRTLNKYNYNCKIKWPNDILLNNKKVCGILTEMNCELDKINYLILGIGLNVNISSIDDTLKDKATSLFLCDNRIHNLNLLLSEILSEFDPLYNEFLLTEEIPSSLEVCKNNSYLIGKEIIITTFNKNEVVECIDISSDGSLLIRDSHGNIRPVLSGEVSLNKNY
ncbi:MAG: biotin--[acetyl-CoA-carboxylase] ligase, partial [Clostridium sp.]